jgi:hypothetical protein
MTESDWLSSGDPMAMLGILGNRTNERKLRLFAVGCCRTFRDMAQDESYRQAIETSEAFADGRATKASLRRTRLAIRAQGRILQRANAEPTEAHFANWIAEYTAWEMMAGQKGGVIGFMYGLGRLSPDKQVEAASLLRCVVGNPFRPAPHLPPAMLTPDVVKLADGIYAERAFERLPVLGDALEDAGCADTGILEHCRTASVHARGCWVVDGILGKG